MERLQQEMKTKALVLADLQKNVRAGETKTQLKCSKCQQLNFWHNAFAA